MEQLQCRALKQSDRAKANAFLTERWGSVVMMVRTQRVDMSQLPGILVEKQGEIVALLTYRMQQKRCEIISLDSLLQGQGIATSLIESLLNLAGQAGCERVSVVTTNDNLNALRFYQKRGFLLSALYPGSVDCARRQKPQIPTVGEYGIPLHTEIELERSITSATEQP